MTQVSIRGRRAAVGRGNNRGEAAKVGGIGGEQRACRRGAQLKPRGKLQDLSVTSQRPKYRPRCWNTVDVKRLRNRKRSWMENKRSAEKHFIWLPVSPRWPHAQPASPSHPPGRWRQSLRGPWAPTHCASGFSFSWVFFTYLPFHSHKGQALLFLSISWI